MTTKTIKFIFKKSTTNKDVYEEKPAPGNPTLVGTLYVSNWFAEKAPEITITIHGDEQPRNNVAEFQASVLSSKN